MLPSERIFQIFSNYRQKKGGNKNEDRIMAIIKFLDEKYEQEKPCEICNDNEIFTCIECGRKAIRDAYGKPISKELCIKGGNFGCTCENCTKHFMERLNRIFSPNTQ